MELPDARKKWVLRFALAFFRGNSYIYTYYITNNALNSTHHTQNALGPQHRTNPESTIYTLLH